MEQLTLDFSNEEKQTFAARLDAAVKATLEGQEDFFDFIHIEQTGDKGKDREASVRASSSVVVKVKKFVKYGYTRVSFKPKYDKYFDGYTIEEYDDGEKALHMIRVDDLDQVLLLADNIGNVLLDAISSMGNAGFGCCSRFIDCSDAGHCLMPDKKLAIECAYRKNLEDGRIFYGKNKNI